MEKMENIIKIEEFKTLTDKEMSDLEAETYNKVKGNLKFVDCPICKNKGNIMIVKYEPTYDRFITSIRECECQKKRKALMRASNSGLGDYLEKRFDDFTSEEGWQKEIKTRAIEYCQNEDKYWFITLGQSGAGKTLISSIIANYLLIKKNKEVYYITWTDFISKLKRDMMSENSEDVTRYLDYIKNVEVLYIDELLKKYNETDLKYIIEIINYRYSKNLQTIISSEKTVDELLDIDEATMGRMIEKASERYLINIPKDRKKNYRLKNILY